MGVMNPGLVMRNIIPVVMAGVLGIYGLIVAVILQVRRRCCYVAVDVAVDLVSIDPVSSAAVVCEMRQDADRQVAIQRHILLSATGDGNDIMA
jgi:ATP synthase subunit C